MTNLYTSAQCRELDRLMIEQQGVAGFDLMRRAGQAAFDELIHRWPEVRAVSICCGFTSQGNLPIALQIGGRPFAEETLFRAAHAYEQATPWHTQKPKI